MISPTPFSLCCALILCLPLAFLFSTTTNTNTNSLTPTIILTSCNNNTNITILVPQINNTTIKINNNSVDVDDEALFKLAYKVNPNPSPNKKIAFMFLTTTPLSFSPLWELFFNQTQTQNTQFYNIYIHADPSFKYNNPPFSPIFSNKLIPSKPTHRFSPSLIAVTRRLLANALLNDTSNAMFALLSPSCIPLHSFSFTYDALFQTNNSFIEILNKEPGAYDRWVARGNDTMLPEVPLDAFRVGSQFFVLTRQHARMVVGDERRLWEKFKIPCVRRDVCYPEEHFFPTLISMSSPRGVIPATLTHVDWKGRSDGHPRTYFREEVSSELIQRLRSDSVRYGDFGSAGNESNSNRKDYVFLFARKFSPDCLQPLMDLAKSVIFRD